ncbi:uncharacterized protein LOC126923664 [Bombus affinis]|uniref:uncharacterized protein LOC126923664 n=1 Tax=Bombus affinis TaxID=309941 RepID=UPI0021B7DC80|nr:uncharacterized protein LOC126923664 [Bombus affinis]
MSSRALNERNDEQTSPWRTRIHASGVTTPLLLLHAIIIVPRSQGRKQKSNFSKSSTNAADKELAKKNKAAKDTRLTTNLPDDAAVHFGNFYGIQKKSNKPRAGRVRSLLDSTSPSSTSYKPTPRLEFTRQMVQKLERTAGTKEYARQVSALLEETVEPAHFKLHSLPTENSIPDGRYNPTGFPLWYKEPYKMPFASDEVYKLLKERLDNAEEGKARDIFKEDSSERSSLEEWSEDEEARYGEENFQDDGAINFLTRERSSMNLLSNGSSSVTEAKDTDSKESNQILLDKKPSKLVSFQQR